MSSFDSLDRNMPILVVDDTSTMRRVVKSCLLKLGFKNVVEAEDGKSAWEKLKTESVQFIISDWSMPEMNGKDLLEAVRKDSILCNIPFLVVAAEAQKDEIQNSVHSEGQNVIVKPFTADILQSKMDALFSGNEKD